MKILYISSACNPNKIEEIDKTANKKIQISGIKFHNLLIKGLGENGIDVKSIIGLPISIKTNKKVIWKEQIDKNKNIEYIQVGFINLPLIKQITILLGICKNIFEEYKKGKKLYVIIDTTYVTIVPLVTFIAKRLKIKIIGITADIYNYMCNVENDVGKSKTIIKIVRKVIQKSYSKLDGFILLTKQMNEVINKSKKPYIIIEGVVDGNESIKYTMNKTKNKKIILYSGALYKKFGIENLIKAFEMIKDNNTELHLYGFGELEEYIKRISKKDERIKFFGMVSNETIVTKQKEATILVNPRPTFEEFTKYSFPSKNMEYMASGTPVITTKLEGIPNEYYDYVYTFDDYSVEGIKNKIEEIISKPEDELRQLGIKARRFVLKNKNNIKQTQKIIKLIEKV